MIKQKMIIGFPGNKYSFIKEKIANSKEIEQCHGWFLPQKPKMPRRINVARRQSGGKAFSPGKRLRLQKRVGRQACTAGWGL